MMHPIFTRIDRLISILHVHDLKGHRISFDARRSDCFIITIRGSIRFTFKDDSIVTDPSGSIFIPKGAAYTNECLEDAESILVNFDASGSAAPRRLNPIDPRTALQFYETISRSALADTERAHYYLLSQLYLLTHQLLPHEVPENSTEQLAEAARSYLQREFHRSALQIPDVALHCHVSAVYLRKIFRTQFHQSPSAMLTEIRMHRARELLLERQPVQAVSTAVGYSDIYQFSRAYKRYFGYVPSQTR